MLKFTGLHGIGDDTVEAVYVKIDYTYTLAFEIMVSCIGVKFSWKNRFSVEANVLRKWD